MSRSPDVVVVGGGIVGLCAALAATDRGLEVTLVDDARPGAASRSSAGMLGPSLPGLPTSLRALASDARDLYPQFLATLAEQSGVDVALDRSGILEIATSPEELEALEARGEVENVLSQRELADLEPSLGAHAGAIHHPLDGWVDNRALMDALFGSAARDVRLRVLRDKATSFEFEGDGARVVLSNGSAVACSRVVLATGAWCELPGLPSRVPVRPVKGELLTLDHCPIRHVVYGARGYVVPRGRSALVGATSEDASFDSTPTAVGRLALVRAAADVVPSLSEARVVAHWGGLRPVSPDGLPILGALAGNPALVHACGFSRNGILLAPWAGRTLGAFLAGESGAGFPPGFHPSRFVGNNNRS